MPTTPQPSTKGQMTEFHQDLFWELVETLHVIPDILEMSLSEALLARYGSKQAVDKALGEGTYQGVKQSHGGLSSWRKAWNQVLKAERLRYAKEVGMLAILRSCIEGCVQEGVPSSLIMDEARN